ncbi:hypothetical protein [Streptomyces sp. NPDC002054]|uniref:hypothetical protein n=1 Tax=Streptomyces sp. NPDC002054 TaxID=3154663 RepID=UPI0033208844
MFGQRIKLTALLVAVVLALTVGGCAGSKSKRKSKSKSRTGTSAGRNGGSPTATPTPTSTAGTAEGATAVVTVCATAARPVTTVRITSGLEHRRTFEVSVRLEGAGAGAALVEEGRGRVTLGGRESRTFDIDMAAPARAGEVGTCRVGEVRTVTDPTARPTSRPKPGLPSTTNTKDPSKSTSTSRNGKTRRTR